MSGSPAAIRPIKIMFMKLLGREDFNDRIFRGSERYMTVKDEPVDSDAARDLVKRVHECEDVLYVIAIGEINMLDYIIDKAYEKKMKIILNPSPFDEKLDNCDLGKIYLFLLNEIEGEQITGYKDKDQILNTMAEKFPNARFVLTLGSDGAFYYDGKVKIFQDIFKVKAVDTTAAGDTFTGYFIAAMIEGRSVSDALRMAAKASSIAVSRPGATPSIPTVDEVKKELVMKD